jgi:hypothetical protein
MILITHLSFNDQVYTFNVNGVGYQLTNAGQYNPTTERYRWRNPHPGMENERFILIGDGNYVVANDRLIQEVAFVILLKVGTEDYYTLQRSVFNKEFILV